MSRQASLLIGGLLAAALFTTVGISRADDPEPGASVAVPYAATLLDAQGEPLSDSVDVAVRVFTDATDDGELLYAESHPNVAVTAGHLYLVIGTGDPLDGYLTAEGFLAHPSASIEVEIDGELLAGRQQLGRVPRAVTADAVSAKDVRYGGEHGYIPAEAVAQNVTLAHYDVESGALLPEPPAGWSCDYAAELVSPWQALDLVGGPRRAEERWVARVGGGTVALEDGLLLDFPAFPYSNGDRKVRLRRAWRSCTDGCPWQEESVTNVPVHVTRMCSPDLPGIPDLQEP